MKYSSRASYALRAIFHLADCYGQRSVSASQIAKYEGLSLPFLEQILHHLKRKHWIKSLRGPTGGYVLAKKPSDIKLGPILRELEIERPLKEIRNHPKDASPAAAASGLFWGQLSSHIDDFIDTTSVKNLMDEAAKAKKTRAKSGQSSFSI